MFEFSQPAAYEASLNARLEVIATRLGTLVGNATSTQLTYGQLVQRYGTDESPDLPAGAVKCDDREVDCLLMEGHLQAIDRYLLTQVYRPQPSKLAGFPVQQLDAKEVVEYFGLDSPLHPKVEGYDWYRGYLTVIDEGVAAILCAPWIQPWHKGGSPFPIVYTLGNPRLEDVRSIVAAYNNYPNPIAAE